MGGAFLAHGCRRRPFPGLRVPDLNAGNVRAFVLAAPGGEHAAVGELGQRKPCASLGHVAGGLDLAGGGIVDVHLLLETDVASRSDHDATVAEQQARVLPPALVHLRSLRPLARRRIEDLGGLERLPAFVRTPEYHRPAVAEGDSAEYLALGGHLAHRGPLTRRRIVDLGPLQPGGTDRRTAPAAASGKKTAVTEKNGDVVHAGVGHAAGLGERAYGS